MEKYVFNEYEKEYKKYFQLEKNNLQKALEKNTKIEHVGSTAIPGLGGKGIIDVVVGINDDLRRQVNVLENAGYEFREVASTPERLFFRKDYTSDNKVRRVHIHLVKFNGKDWNEMISFREYLLNHPEVVKKYAQIKKEAVEKAKGEGVIYREFKRKFIEEITRKQLAKKGQQNQK